MLPRYAICPSPVESTSCRGFAHQARVLLLLLPRSIQDPYPLELGQAFGSLVPQFRLLKVTQIVPGLKGRQYPERFAKVRAGFGEFGSAGQLS